tara:strand:- start:18007 stop:20190 length:2184 start_codon:yes stop_codon:yes gene_type:complete
MGFEDDEILQDFLVESGEILELLSEQLVELENNPEDKDLLNAIFRGFHTVKGGAGFLQLDALVGCCHIAENVFDILRNGKRSVDADLMDVVLRALDAVNEMFDEVRDGKEATPASPELLNDLQRFAKPVVPNEESSSSVPVETVNEETSGGDITDDEFEQLLDALDGDAKVSPTSSSQDSESNEITDDEFENLLDELHGSGKPIAVADKAVSGAGLDSSSSEAGDISEEEFEKLLDDLHGEGKFNADGAKKTSDSSSSPKATSPVSVGDDELITDDEFESLLDELHGSGGSPTIAKTSGQAKPTPSPTPAKVPATPPKAEVKVAPKPAPVAKATPTKKSDSIATETTVRVDTKRLDDIMNMVGELVLVRNRLKRLGDASPDEAMQKAVSNLDVVTGDLQSAVMQTRMQPIKKVFGRFPRVVRDLARTLKKEVNLILVGEETDLDKNLVEALSDPLVHLVRNAVDHGIEMPDVRMSKGKDRVGQVVLSAQQEGDHIMLAIEDDGAGMDADVLRAKAVEKGLYDQDAADRLSDTECFNLIFAPGFSTKTEISDVSGRGVGMDVVKTKITQLNGTVSITSEPGKGSKLSIKVPLTLAIMPTLMVKLGNQSFAFPLVSVVEIFHLDLRRTNVVDGQECVVVRDNVYPLFYIKRWLVKGYTEDAESAHVVIVSVGNKRVGFIVDQLVGQEEVVIKPLGDMLHGTAGMAGATITGDGRIALILDIPSLLDRYA